MASTKKLRVIPGQSLTIVKDVFMLFPRFSISLCAQPYIQNKTPLHINPRFTVNEVARNHYDNGKWHEPETDGEFPFVRGDTYRVKVVVTDASFKVRSSWRL